MADTTYIKISAARTPYRRAGLDLREPVELAASILTADQRAALERDPVVHIQTIAEAEVGLSAGQAIDRAKAAERVADLDALAENETRKTVIAAIEKRRDALAAE